MVPVISSNPAQEPIWHLAPSYGDPGLKFGLLFPSPYPFWDGFSCYIYSLKVTDLLGPFQLNCLLGFGSGVFRGGGFVESGLCLAILYRWSRIRYAH
jgi:hypothetical protein